MQTEVEDSNIAEKLVIALGKTYHSNHAHGSFSLIRGKLVYSEELDRHCQNVEFIRLESLSHRDNELTAFMKVLTNDSKMETVALDVGTFKALKLDEADGFFDLVEDARQNEMEVIHHTTTVWYDLFKNIKPGREISQDLNIMVIFPAFFDAQLELARAWQQRYPNSTLIAQGINSLMNTQTNIKKGGFHDGNLS